MSVRVLVKKMTVPGTHVFTCAKTCTFLKNSCIANLSCRGLVHILFFFHILHGAVYMAFFQHQVFTSAIFTWQHFNQFGNSQLRKYTLHLEGPYFDLLMRIFHDKALSRDFVIDEGS